MKVTLIGTKIRVLRDHAAAAAAVELSERLEAHKLDDTEILQNGRLDKEEQECPTLFRLM